MFTSADYFYICFWKKGTTISTQGGWITISSSHYINYAIIYVLSIHSLLSSSLRKVRAVTVSPRKLSRMLQPAPPLSSRFPLSTLPFTPRSRKEWADASGQVEFPRVKWSPACRGQCPRRIVVVVSRSCVIQIWLEAKKSRNWHFSPSNWCCSQSLGSWRGPGSWWGADGFSGPMETPFLSLSSLSDLTRVVPRGDGLYALELVPQSIPRILLNT